MTPTWLPFVLGFTGAFVGGAALLAVYFLTRHEARRQHRLDVRREAYAEMMSSFMEATRIGIEARGRDRAPKLDVANATGQRLHSAAALIRLISPPDTALAAIQLASDARLFAMDIKSEERVRDFEFEHLAARDLGLVSADVKLRQRLASKRGLGWLDRERPRESAS